MKRLPFFTYTSSIVLCGELRAGGGGSATVFTCTSQDVGVFSLSLVREDDLPPSPRRRTLAVHKLPVNGKHEFSNNSEPLLRATPRCAESLSPPVITLKTAGRAPKKQPTCLSKLFSLSNCPTHIHRITGLILLYNHRSLFPLIVSLLNLFVCVHTLATQMFFCHANRAICAQGN